MTPGAISQQLRQLQERLGVNLFDRTRHGVVLSAAGARVYPELLLAFEQIAQSLQTLERWETRRTLRISAAPSFAAQWLAPRLGEFSALQPQVDVQLDASPALADLRRDGVDIAIRHGLGRYPGLHAEHLLAPVLLPVASPALLSSAPPWAPCRIACNCRCCRMPIAATGGCGSRHWVWQPMIDLSAALLSMTTCC